MQASLNSGGLISKRGYAHLSRDVYPTFLATGDLNKLAKKQKNVTRTQGTHSGACRQSQFAISIK